MSGVQHSRAGAFNLLKNCMEVHAGNSVLVVCEDPNLGWYDREASELLETAVSKIGAAVTLVQVGHPDDRLPAEYNALIDQHDTIVYLARIGDQDRFHDKLPGKNVAMLYTRDAAALSSDYAAVNHIAMKAFKQAVDRVSISAKQITISCPLGTRVNCAVNSEVSEADSDVTIKRFPLCVPQPILAGGTSGRVALVRWLTPTGSQSYSPACCRLDSPVFAEVVDGRITGFDGEAECVAAVNAHYDFVADKFGIDRDVVHSWHAGIHPACAYSGAIDDDPDRWSNNIFGSPRFLHFHTCGDYPPGEICWMVLDPTVEIDGVPLWQDGRLVVDNFEETAAVVNQWPELRILMATKNLPIGFDA